MTHPFELTIERTDGAGNIYFEAAAGVTTFLLAGRWLEGRAKRRAGAALRALMELGAKDVAVLRDGREVRVPVGELRRRRHCSWSAPARRSPPTASSTRGTSAIDAAMLTGESVPVEVGPGDAVVGATVNAGGRLVVRATRVGADTQLAQMARLVEEAQHGKAEVQRLADRVSGIFVPVVLAAGRRPPWASGSAPAPGPSAAVTAAVAVLIIACPCALGLATPTALMVGTGRGAQLGILIRGPEVLESTRRVDTVVLDKTGTVTTGVMTVLDVVAARDETADEVLRLAGALEDASEHPIARAVAAHARARLGDAAAGRGLREPRGARRPRHGRRPGRRGRSPRPARRARPSAHRGPRPRRRPGPGGRRDGGRRRLGRRRPGRRRGGGRGQADLRRGGTRLRDLGLRPILLTGDHRRDGRRRRGRRSGIDDTDVIAGVLPAGKVDEVRRLQAEGRVVAMVGDGVNDAAALAQADLGLAMGTGTDAAIEASDLTLVRGDLRVAADAVRLARRTLAIIKGNLFWAFAYNVAALPLAAAGLLNPMLAGAAMAASSVFVVSNSLRLRGFRPAQRDQSMSA